MAWKEKQRNKPPAGFHGRATYIHPPIASCMVPLILPNCQDSWISFAFISYPQDTKCCQPAAVCSVSHLLFLFYLPLCLSLSLCVSPWKKKKKHQAGVAGKETDGKDDRRNFLEGGDENQKMWRTGWIQQTCKHIPLYILFTFYCFICFVSGT